MKRAALRHQLDRWRSLFGIQPTSTPPDAPLPTFTPLLYQLALVAVGDGDSAAVLTADTLLQLRRQPSSHAPSPDVAAVRMLKRLLPRGWLSWPGAAGPSEWLRLGLRREQADRVLSVLGEHDPLVRIALALHLLYDVRRDDLDAWLGTQGMGDQVVQLAAYIGQGLELLPPPPQRPACLAVAADLVDADQPQLGRNARLHIVGCDECRRRAQGLRRCFAVLGEALLAFFRTPLPASFDTLLRKRAYQLQHPPIRWRPIAAAAAAVLLLLFVQRAARGEPARFANVPPAPADAAELLERAIGRLDAKRPSGEVWHETISFASNGERLQLERWYEFSRVARARIIVRPENGDTPLLDIVNNGRAVAYALNRDGSTPQQVLLREADTAAIAPLLRQLPYAGNLGDRLIDQRTLDLTLLAQARAADPRLLGSTIHNGRPAWMLAAQSPAAGSMSLTIDRDTATLLEARIGDGGSQTRTRLVWNVERFEVSQRNDLPPQTFALIQGSNVSMINPRQLTLRPPAQMDIDDAAAHGLLPLPKELPDEVVLSYVRPQWNTGRGLLAVYESRWSTLQIIAPLAGSSSRPPSAFGLDRQFNGGSYTIIEQHPSTEASWPNMSFVEFELDSAPQTRFGLFYWHAFADAAQREAAVQRVLDSLDQAGMAAQAPGAWSAQHGRLQQLTLRIAPDAVLR